MVPTALHIDVKTQNQELLAGRLSGPVESHDSGYPNTPSNFFFDGGDTRKQTCMLEIYPRATTPCY